MTPDQDITTILRSRAKDLARPARTLVRDETLDNIVFRLDRTRFGVPLGAVLEVFTPRHVTPLPGWARGNAGLTAWRGDLLLVIDVRDMLGVPAAPNTRIDRTVVLRGDRITAGIIVDEIMGIEQIAANDLRPLSDRLATAGTGVVTGVTSTGVIVLDPAALLSSHG